MADTWFVVNARDADARWVERAGFGKRCLLEPEGGEFEQVGIHLSVIAPGGTRHVFVNEATEPCVLLMVGARTGGGIHYPVSEVALRHGAGVEVEASSARDAYAGLEPWRPADPAAL